MQQLHIFIYEEYIFLSEYTGKKIKHYFEGHPRISFEDIFFPGSSVNANFRKRRLENPLTPQTPPSGPLYSLCILATNVCEWTLRGVYF